MAVYDIKVGYSCNNKCVHCVIQDCKADLLRNGKSIDLSQEEIFALLNSARNAGADRIVLTGGEISIRKDFPDILHRCMEMGFETVVQTNGRLLNKPAIIEAISAYENISFVVALHGVSAKTHDSITQVSGSFKESLKGMQAMTKLGRKVTVKVVLSRYNQSELADLVRLSFDQNFSEICIAYPHGHGAARVNYKKIAPEYSDLKKILNEAGDIADELDFPLFFEAIPFCVVPAHLKKVGELSFLNFSDSYFVPVNKNAENWCKVRKEIKQKFSRCSECLFDKMCEGVWAEYIEHFDSEMEPIIGSKEQQEQLVRILT